MGRLFLPQINNICDQRFQWLLTSGIIIVVSSYRIMDKIIQGILISLTTLTISTVDVLLAQDFERINIRSSYPLADIPPRIIEDSDINFTATRKKTYQKRN